MTSTVLKPPFPSGTSFVLGREIEILPLLFRSRTWGLSVNRVVVSALESPMLYFMPPTSRVTSLVISVTETWIGPGANRVSDFFQRRTPSSLVSTDQSGEFGPIVTVS